MQILLVEDDVKLARALSQILVEAGYTVDAVHDGQSGLSYGKTGQYDVIILDVMLPKMDGLTVIKELRRADVSTPTLMLTALGTVRDKIDGFDSGADDYMTKPFAPSELLAHLRALTRRQGRVVFETLQYGDLTLNLESHELACADKSIHLGFKEFTLCQLFMASPSQVMTKDVLLEKVWGSDAWVADNNLEAYISFLRKKFRFLGSRVTVESLRKTGYRLACSAENGDGEAAADAPDTLGEGGAE